MTSRSLNDLSAAFRPLAVELLAQLVECRIPVVIVNTLRGPEEQADYLRRGVSWTQNSRHLADATGKANAMDLCPYLTYVLHGNNKLQWDSNDPTWQKMGQIGESLGLRWGGRWSTPDLGHFELPL